MVPLFGQGSELLLLLYGLRDLRVKQLKVLRLRLLDGP